MKNRTKTLSALGLGAAAALALSACSPPGSSNSSETLDNGDKQAMKMVVFNGWDEDTAASELWKYVLEQKGYDVELDYADPAPAYQGLAQGDYDAVLDTWLPNTHKAYMEKYGDTLDDLGSWNDQASLELTVNADAPIDSLADLAAHKDDFGGRIVGIEPGAGETAIVKDKVMKAYGLEDWELVTSSTPAMLSELKKSEKDGSDIVVTLWRPHWAYSAFDVKDLEDPKGALGDNESIHTVVNEDFGDDFPQAEKWLKEFEMDSDTLYSLEDVLVNSGADQSEYQSIVEKWVGENEDYVDSLTSGK
ncbi:glycine betaine ABC transporter substrate-binding protein [Curtobacterium sp. VKM Ac-1376]|uniref:glycine betaine ABC transporter substrate-binding protein n=1 Tax=Curtobacterium sp. VKM Ac-1376 TaxID=123312 RepID=UPI00188B60AB|nr:glycine betaine ABC transporter substrate-binding protein [Curtobacterium sp. VKM Ac-1376]MBF4616250.1 glycine betaine ABC transporter substrate-binding protein [Curtobacterium sp. VKM Ac-1376]